MCINKTANQFYPSVQEYSSLEAAQHTLEKTLYNMSIFSLCYKLNSHKLIQHIRQRFSFVLHIFSGRSQGREH